MRRQIVFIALSLTPGLLLASESMDQAAETLGDLPLDKVATATIQSATTDPKYLTSWIDRLPDHPTIPSPRDYLGYTVGTPGELTQVEEIHGYFRELARHSPRLKLFTLGKSFEDREMLLAVIADEVTLDNLDHYRNQLAALADPRLTDAAAAEEIVGTAKPIYWMTAGLHSPELGPPEMVMELAYRLVVETREPFQTIRNNVITMITPVTEVDGRARQVDWFKLHQKGRKDYFDRPPASVPFWGHYTYHDNNRDGISISQNLTRNYTRGVYEWHPTVSLDLHESVPLLYVAGGTGPYNTGVNPVTISEWQALANYEISRLSGLGLSGVWTWGYYTGWYPGYLLWTTNNHNGMGRFYETFGNASSETMQRTIKNSRFANEKTTDRTWYRPDPPPRELTWSMRNNTNYMQTGVLASLEMVANNSTMFLHNYYQKAVDALVSAIEEKPFAFLIPADQNDRGGANYLVEVLGRHAIEISQVDRSRKFGEVDVERGDLLVKLDQLYGPLAKTLLEKQTFPSKVQVPPYDDVAWTLGHSYGAEVVPIDDKDILAHLASPFEGQFLSPAAAPRSGRYLALPNLGQAELGPIRFALGASVSVQMTDEIFKAQGREFAAGTLLISMTDDNIERVRSIVSDHFTESTALRRLPDVQTHELDLPRVAVLHSWISTQNAGWARYSLDAADVPFTLLAKDEIHRGSLRKNFDVIVVPAFRGQTTFKSILGGVDTRWSPLAYTTTEATPNIGKLLASDDITGGIGFRGMQEIEEFVRSGGTLITLGSGGVIAAESGLVPDILVKRPPGLNTPGSVLTAKTTANSPLTYGYPEITHVFRTNGPIFSVADHHRDWVSLQFGTKDVKNDDNNTDDTEESDGTGKKVPLVVSGGILGEQKAIDGEPALISRALDEGHVVIFNWNPLHRDVNHHDHGFFYNAVLNWNDLSQ